MAGDSKTKEQLQSHAGAKTHEPKPEDSDSAGKMGFTDEQYEHFKFGLIKRNGERVPDYEEKLAHYEAYVARGRKRKGAA